MGQKSNDATQKDVQTLLRKEECASSMGQISHTKLKLKLEECAGGTGKMQRPDDATKKDAQSLLREEECA